MIKVSHNRETFSLQPFTKAAYSPAQFRSYQLDHAANNQRIVLPSLLKNTQILYTKKTGFVLHTSTILNNF